MKGGCRVKINTPVTQREKPFPKGRYIVSKTDLKGIITDVNDTFIEVSGFTREELIGKNHNIVRHPDMPPQAFEDLWRTIKAGYPWRGIVKNRAKDGDHYWVEALVTPMRQNGEVVGYLSVRREASREAIAAAEALYRTLNASKGKLDTSPPWWKRITIRSRLIGAMAIVGAMLVGGAVVGVGGIYLANQSLSHVNESRLKPIELVGAISLLMTENARQTLLGLQHDPVSPFVKMHDHPLEAHTDAILKNQEALARLIEELEKRLVEPEWKEKLAAYREARASYVQEGLLPAREALLKGDFLEANRLILQKINPLLAKARGQAQEIEKQLEQAAEGEYAAAQQRFEWIRALGIVGTIGALLMIIALSWNLLASIHRRLAQAVAHFEKLAQGDLTDRIDLSGRDEIGRMLCELAAMQTQLAAIADALVGSAHTIESASTLVETRMQAVTKQSSEQREGVMSVAAATEEFSTSVQQVATDAADAFGAAEASRSKIENTRGEIEASVAATTRVVEAVKASAATIDSLREAVAKIGIISATIREIADQTNLLALNAAIEAARAGEMGRGFAVVADEVRKLAERTAASTADITATVSEIRTVAERAVSAMNHAVGEVEHGIEEVRAGASGLMQIGQAAGDIFERAKRIAEATREQAAASEQVANEMEHISQLIDRNLQTVLEANAAAESLRATAEQLRQTVDHFKVA
ncbi:MAG: methyl-accepting chemotaxis protein [Rhodocyclaceae bacterium]|nr:methyl-accepting chemotaxis protein [Rhodocyclaceae bacterium]